MPRVYKTYDQFEGFNDAVNQRKIKPSEFTKLENYVTDDPLGEIRSPGAFTTHSEIGTKTCDPIGGYGLYYFSTDHVKGSSAVDTGEDWIALCDANECQIDLYDRTGDVWTGGAVDLGTVNSYAPGAGKIDFPTTSTITDSDSGFISTGKIKKGDQLKISGCTTETANNLASVIVTKVIAGTITVYGTPLTVEATEAGTVTLTVLTQPIYHFVDEALRVADASMSAATRSKWYGYIKRTHFNGLTPGGSADTYDNWYSKNNDLVAPTRGLFGLYVTGRATDDANSTATNLRSTQALAFDEMKTEIDAAATATEHYIAISRSDSEARNITVAVDDDDLTTVALTGTWQNDEHVIYPAAGKGFTMFLTPGGTTGTWTAGDYEFASTFIYDNNQESKIFKMAGNGDLIAVTANQRIYTSVYATSPFDPRVTGGRIYVRKYDTDDEWCLYADISLRNGLRMRLADEYTAWAGLEGVGGGASDIYCYNTAAYSYEINVETYEMLNGFSASEVSIDVGQTGDGYKSSVIGNRRCFILNVKRTNEDSEQIQMRDAIFYSPINKFDTFPLSNRIDVIKGDGEDYVKGEFWNGDLLAFKQRTLYVIDVSSPSSSQWFLKHTYKYGGVAIPAAVTKTKYGIVWTNEYGCFLYDGKKELTNFTDGKIKPSTWSSFITQTSMIGYQPLVDRIFVVDEYVSTSGGADAWIFSVKNNSWSKKINFFPTVDVVWSNLEVDWNGNMIGYPGTGASVVVQEWSDTAVASTAGEFILIDDVFDNPGTVKEIYGISITYKSSAAQTTPLEYYTNGGTSVTNLTGDFSVTSTWAVLRATPTPFICNSLQIACDCNTSGTQNFSDVTVEYRELPRKQAS